MKTLGILLLCLALLSPLASARTWTAVDGRTLEASFVSATAEAVKVKRDSDSREFELVLEQLSPEDRKWVEEKIAPPPRTGTTAPGVGSAPAVAAEATPEQIALAESQLRAFEQACHAYRDEYHNLFFSVGEGRSPSLATDNSRGLLAALFGHERTRDEDVTNRYRKRFLEPVANPGGLGGVKEGVASDGRSLQWLDPWGNPYFYRIQTDASALVDPLDRKTPLGSFFYVVSGGPAHPAGSIRTFEDIDFSRERVLVSFRPRTVVGDGNEVARAREQAERIRRALQHYNSVYMRAAVSSGLQGKPDKVLLLDNAHGLLTAAGGTKSVFGDKGVINPKAIRFLIPPVTEDGRGGILKGVAFDDPGAVWNDPWGNPYLVAFETSYDHRLEIPGLEPMKKTPVLVISAGPGYEPGTVRSIEDIDLEGEGIIFSPQK